jgi:hypothetical protein
MNQLCGRAGDAQRVSLSSSKGIADNGGGDGGEPAAAGSDAGRRSQAGKSVGCWQRRSYRVAPTREEQLDPSVAAVGKRSSIKPKKAKQKDVDRIRLPADEKLCKMFAVATNEKEGEVNAGGGDGNSLFQKPAIDEKLRELGAEEKRANESKSAECMQAFKQNSVRGDNQFEVDVHANDEDPSDSDTIAAESETDGCTSEHGHRLSVGDPVSEMEDEAKSESSESDEADETDVHSTSNYSIASSDTAALSIRLDENYEPIDPLPVSVEAAPLPKVSRQPAVKAVVRPMDAVRSAVPVLQASASLPKTTVASSQLNSATQTSTVPPKVSPDYQFPPPHFNPYTPYGYGSYLPQMPFGHETPIWPPYGFVPPPLPPWYYHNPYFDVPPYFPLPAPPYYGMPYDFMSPPNTGVQHATETHDVNSRRPEPSGKASDKHTASVPDKLSTAVGEKEIFKPKATDGRFVPSIGSLFRPITATSKQPAINRDAKVDRAYSQSLLEMVELVTPNFDTSSSGSCKDHDEDDMADEERGQRAALEAEEEQRLRMRRRHTRQWIRALQTEFGSVENCAEADSCV